MLVIIPNYTGKPACGLQQDKSRINLFEEVFNPMSSSPLSNKFGHFGNSFKAMFHKHDTCFKAGLLLSLNVGNELWFAIIVIKCNYTFTI